MDARLIDRLARRDPEHSSWSGRSANVLRQTYYNPAFGWEIAASCARARVLFPETVFGRNHGLFRAYMMILDPSRYHDPHVDDAYRLSKEET